MTLLVTFDGGVCTVQARTDDDRKPDKFRSETAFWYALKSHLNYCRVPFLPGVNFDLVKKVMSDDGHMVGGDGYPYYLRDRKWRFCIHDSEYALRDLAKEFNEMGVVRLSVMVWAQA